MSDTRPDGEAVDETRTSEYVDADGDAVEKTETTVWTGQGEERTSETKVWTPDGDERVVESSAEYVPGSYSTRLYDADEVPAETSTRTSTPDAETRAYAPEAETRAYTPDAETRAYSADAETVAVAPVAPVATAAPVQQPIFVQAPEQPTPRGNRAAAGAIGLLAAIVFGILYLGVGVGLAALAGQITADTLVPALLAALTSWALWVPVAVFFLAFWLLGAIINRGPWGAWVIFGLLVGVAAYGGHILGVLFQASFWTLTAREGAALAESQLFAPLAIAAFIIGRELTIWFGAWVARRGRRMTELNIEAQREYERTLEAGPKLYAS